MKKVYYLSTCDTCKRIMNELNLSSDFILQDIKSEAISLSQIEEMKSLAGSYESLFSKRARLYKERNLKNQVLTEDHYKNLILEHYTFLKRPVILFDNQIFIGNSKKVVEAANIAING
ncbi:arsenate reductase family protein [Aquimarina sp. Aq107]|uniref:arsenate reductase family protein n=1 Tax=Aquimarina sp. Aq107 TaxID=1191912 RepID=UPI000D551549|nr:ArsC/Spx/MgsR family protein [Aquimarina sp. Aq107]